MAKKTAADQFIAGKPAVYSGFDDALYTATYSTGERNGLGIGSLEIKNSVGEVTRDMLMAEHMARTFFWNLDATTER
jgi:hypothetical protein